MPDPVKHPGPEPARTDDHDPFSGERIMRLALEMAQAVSAELELDSLCELIVERLAALTDADITALLFVDEAHKLLKIRRARGISEEASRAFVSSSEDGLFGWVIRSRSPLFTFGPSADVVGESAKHVEGGPFGRVPGPVVVAPLIADRRVQGILVLARTRGREPFVPGEQLLVDVLCSQIAQSIDNAWLYGQLRARERELEDKVAQRTRELDAKARVLERALLDLEEMQTQYVQREKMASLGQLTAGIAHEINNPLAYATSSVAVARDRLVRRRWCLEVERVRQSFAADPDPAHAWDALLALLQGLSEASMLVSDIADFRSDATAMTPEARRELALRFLEFAGDRICGGQDVGSEGLLHRVEQGLARAAEGLDRVKQIVLDLRMYSRLDQADSEAADLDQGISMTIGMTRHLAKERNVSLVFEPGMKGPYTCRGSWMNQVVMNLVVNAIQASHEGGTVTVRTHDEPGRVAIEVQDHGSGIPKEILPRIFDPFFTTKPVGEGMGLGLALCYRVVSDHGGKIEVRSEPGVGSTFVIVLPPRLRGATESSS